MAEHNDSVDIIPVDGDTEVARLRAVSDAIDSHREVVPVRVFRQGGRDMLSGVLPIPVLNRILAYNAAEKGATAKKAIDAMNRPQDPKHTKVIEQYLLSALEKGEHYIMPALTLNCTRLVRVYVPKTGGTPISGYAVLPDEAAVHITDGQHRYLAIRHVFEQLRGTTVGERFVDDSVPVMMTIESDRDQVHQDFADAGRTKPLPPSLLAVYDTRQPANRAVLELANQVPLLNGRVDATSTSLSINSPYVFLVNQVRQFVKGSLTGTPSMQEVSFARDAENRLGNKDAFDRWTSSRVVFLNVMTDLVPDWKEISKLSPPGGPDSAEVLTKTKEIRSRRRVSMAAAFLIALGIVSHEVLKDVTSRPVNQSELEDLLRKKLAPFHGIRWERSAKLWQGNLVVNDGIRTQSPALKAAASEMLGLCGITMPSTK